MSHSMACDLGLHCLPLSHKKDPRLMWIYIKYYYSYINKARMFLLVGLWDFFFRFRVQGNE